MFGDRARPGRDGASVTDYRKIYREHNGCTVKNMAGLDVHHKDGLHSNNCPENLVLLTPEEHAKIHEDDFVLWSRIGGRKGGLTGAGGRRCAELKVGVCGLSLDERIAIGKRTGDQNVVLRRGFCGLSSREMTINGMKGGARALELGAGIHAMSHEEHIELGKRNGKLPWWVNIVSGKTARSFESPGTCWKRGRKI